MDIDEKLQRIERAAKRVEGNILVPADVRVALVDLVDVLKALAEEVKGGKG